MIQHISAAKHSLCTAHACTVRSGRFVVGFWLFLLMLVCWLSAVCPSTQCFFVVLNPRVNIMLCNRCKGGPSAQRHVLESCKGYKTFAQQGHALLYRHPSLWVGHRHSSDSTPATAGTSGAPCVLLHLHTISHTHTCSSQCLKMMLRIGMAAKRKGVGFCG